MQTAQATMLTTLRAVAGFIDANASQLGNVAATGARQRLNDAITALDGHISNQSGGSLVARSLTQKQRALRVALVRDHMKAVSNIAKADLPRTTEFAPLRMSNGRIPGEKLAAAAIAMAQLAQLHTPVFIAAGLPSDFAAQLIGAANNLLDSLASRVQKRGVSKSGTAGMKTKLTEARKVVHILDAFVTSALKDDSSLLANWKLVMRTPKSSAHSGDSTIGTTPVGTPAPGTPAPVTGTPSPAPATTPTPSSSTAH